MWEAEEVLVAGITVPGFRSAPQTLDDKPQPSLNLPVTDIPFRDKASWEIQDREMLIVEDELVEKEDKA